MRTAPLQLEVNESGVISSLQALLSSADIPKNYTRLTKGNAMRSTILAIACGFGLVSASAALADETPAQPPAQAIPAVQDSNPVTCHLIVHEGDLIKGRVCHTKHEWDAIKFRDQESFREFQQRSLEMHP